MKEPYEFFFARFLHRIRTETNDKIVLISNYTQTLDLFEKMCRSKGCVCSTSLVICTEDLSDMDVSDSTVQ